MIDIDVQTIKEFVREYHNLSRDVTKMQAKLGTAIERRKRILENLGRKIGPGPAIVTIGNLIYVVECGRMGQEATCRIAEKV